MSTVIFKWNPSFSSYTMFHYLYDIIDLNGPCEEYFNWSVWDFKNVHNGDKFYWVKLGYGQIGIVGRGEIITDPYKGEDWSGKDRTVFYVDFTPEILINPDALPILPVSVLEEKIPGFEWNRGHSGLILSEEQAEALDKLWDAFVAENKDLFESKAELVDCDYIYWDK